MPQQSKAYTAIIIKKADCDVLTLHWPSLGASHFFKEPWFLYGRKGIKTPRPGRLPGVCFDIDASLFPGPRGRQSQGVCGCVSTYLRYLTLPLPPPMSVYLKCRLFKNKTYGCRILIRHRCVFLGRCYSFFFSPFFNRWLNPLFKIGHKRRLEEDDMYSVLPKDRSKELGDELQR